MSLDVYLHGPIVECRDCKDCSTCGGSRTIRDKQYWSNITHNLNKMAEEAGIYMHLWRPEEIKINKASQLIEPLEKALELMKSDPDRFMKFDSPNGWGTYAAFIPWIERYLNACKDHPDSEISVSR